MRPDRIEPSVIIPGYVALYFPTIVINVPEHFLNSHTEALTKADTNEKLKGLAQELEHAVLGNDPELVQHLVQAFLALRMKLNPPPKQLELFPINETDDDITKALMELKETIREVDDELLDQLIETPEKYKEFKKKEELVSRVNFTRTFIWIGSLVGIITYMIVQAGDFHWGWWVALAFLVVFNKQIILNDKPQGKDNNEN